MCFISLVVLLCTVFEKVSYPMKRKEEPSKHIEVTKRPTAEHSAPELQTIYKKAKKTYKEEEAMLYLCKNCMETIRTKKNIVDKIREDTEAEMIATAGQLDEHIRKVTRILNTVTRMHITDSTEAAERLSKIFDIDVDADTKMENLRHKIAYLEYQRKSKESVFHRIYIYTYAQLHWLITNIVILIRRWYALYVATENKPAIGQHQQLHNEESDVSF